MDEGALLLRARDALPDLTPHEATMMEAAAAGRGCVFPDLTTEIRPEALRWVCSDPDARHLVDPGGLHLENARISGPLDLGNSSVDFPLRINNCIIDGDVILAGARLNSVSLSGTTCSRLIADRAVFGGPVFLRRDARGPFRSASVSFADASIAGVLSADGAHIGPSGGEAASFIIDRARVSGYVVLQEAIIEGSLQACDSRLGGIDAIGMKVAASAHQKCAAAVEIVRGTVAGWVALGERDGRFTKIRGPVIIDGCVIDGGVDFNQARVEAAPEIAPTPGGPESVPAGQGPEVPPVLIKVQHAQIGVNLLLQNVVVAAGRVLVAGTEVGGDLSCKGLWLARFRDNFWANFLKAEDTEKPWLELAITSTHVGGTLDWGNPFLGRNPAVSLSQTSAGLLDIGRSGTGSSWPSRLRLDGLRYRSIEGDFTFRHLRLAGPIYSVRKERERWPRPRTDWDMLLKLLTTAAGSDSAHLNWLRRYTRRCYDPDAYDQLALALESMGRDDDAARVMTAKAADYLRSRLPGWRSRPRAGQTESGYRE
jgi:hypothetical protein